MASANRALAQGQSTVAGAAQRLSQDVSVEAVADLHTGEAQVKAAVAVARTVDETLGTLIDELA